MRAIRRSSHDARVEIMPLIDVVFLLLTFFIYAMVLMVRAEILPVPLETYFSSTPAEPKPSISITLGVDGHVYVGQEAVQVESLVETLAAKKETQPNAVVYLVVEDGEAVIDRGPVLTSVWDQLRAEGLEIFLVGSPKEVQEGDVN